MPPSGDERVDQLVTIIRRAFYRVASLAHRIKQPDGARRRIQADSVAYPGVFGRVVGEHDGHFLLRVRGAPEPCEAGRETREACGSLGVSLVQRERSADG